MGFPLVLLNMISICPAFQQRETLTASRALVSRRCLFAVMLDLLYIYYMHSIASILILSRGKFKKFAYCLAFETVRFFIGCGQKPANPTEGLSYNELENNGI